MSEDKTSYEEKNFEENSTGFISEIMIHQDQLERINRVNLNLEKSNIFNMPSSLDLAIKKFTSRKNEIFYCISSQEMSVDINDISGKVYLPLITKQEIEKRFSSMKTELRSKISMIHFGAIKILIRAQFINGIDTPIKMALIDDRINNRRDAVLGMAQGNLAYGKFMFTVYPKFGVSLNTKNLDRVLSLIHHFDRTDLMNKGDKVFSVTYMVGYALTNSHHSIKYRNKPSIELDEVFQDIGKTEVTPFCEMSEQDVNWAIDIAQNKPHISIKENRVKTRGNKLQISDPETSTSQISQNLENNQVLTSLSKVIDRIHNLETALNRMNG